jgi:hypothetical protein
VRSRSVLLTRLQSFLLGRTDQSLLFLFRLLPNLMDLLVPLLRGQGRICAYRRDLGMSLTLNSGSFLHCGFRDACHLPARFDARLLNRPGRHRLRDLRPQYGACKDARDCRDSAETSYWGHKNLLQIETHFNRKVLPRSSGATATTHDTPDDPIQLVFIS